MSKKLVIAGIGGVGGYFGGMLARKYAFSHEVEVYLWARGRHLNEIRTNGLQIISDEQSIKLQPVKVTDEPQVIGIADCILICCKSYDLNQLMESINPLIGKRTVIIPLLNGIEPYEKLRSTFPEATVLAGCVYIIARLTAPGVITTMGRGQKLCIGSISENQKELDLKEMLTAEGFATHYSPDIDTVVWEKFIYIASVATATSFYNHTIGEIRSDIDKYNSLVSLIQEASKIGIKNGIPLEKDVAIRTEKKLTLFPPDSTSSMHSDFLTHPERTELESLTGWIVRKGEELGVDTPTFDFMYNTLKKSANGLYPFNHQRS